MCFLDQGVGVSLTREGQVGGTAVARRRVDTAPLSEHGCAGAGVRTERDGRYSGQVSRLGGRVSVCMRCGCMLCFCASGVYLSLLEALYKKF